MYIYIYIYTHICMRSPAGRAVPLPGGNLISATTSVHARFIKGGCSGNRV